MLAAHKEYPPSPNHYEESDATIAQQHARQLATIEKQNAHEARRADPSLRESERVAAEIRDVRRRAVERGLLLGAAPPLKPAVSPQRAFEASVSAAADSAARCA